MATMRHKIRGDAFLFDIMQPILDLSYSGDLAGALAQLEALEMPATLDRGRDLHVWFQVSAEKLRHYVKLSRSTDAARTASQMIRVDVVKLEAMVDEFWAWGFTIGLLQYMRSIDATNFMTNAELKPYRDFIESTKHLDDNPKGPFIYDIYLLSMRCALDMRSSAPTDEVFNELLSKMTVPNIDLLKFGHILLLDYVARALTILCKLLGKDAAVAEQVATLSALISNLPHD
jgi:hypothetical protein